MQGPPVSSKAQPCIWMSAGLLAYKLCDRDFDCEHCPLDAALCCRPLLRPHSFSFAQPEQGAGAFPQGYLYSAGHTWLQSVDGQPGEIFKFGLDAFAASMAGGACRLECENSGRELTSGQTVCRIDLGIGFLPLGALVPGRVVGTNGKLRQHPEQVAASPYDNGWILKFAPSDNAELGKLLTPQEARDRARVDLQRFRRQAALHLLADSPEVGPSLQDGGEPVTDLRQMLGATRYLQLLRQLVY